MKSRTSIIRVVKRETLKTPYLILLYFGAVLLSLGIGAILLLSLDAAPLEFYTDMITVGTIGNKFAYKSVENLIKQFVPLLITSLGLSLAFKMKFWNIGGEGQFIVGAITAATTAMLLPANTNTFLFLLCMALCGGLAGGLYGLMTAALKVKFGTNETLMTLMLNYIALYLLKFFGETKSGWNIFLQKESERPVFTKIPEAAWMPAIKIGKFSLNISLLFAVLLVALIYIYLKRTKHGYEISVVGDSLSTARYAGMKVNRIICRTMFFSAFLIGLSGALHVSSAQALSVTITNSVGWTGIIVAWLAKLNPLGVVVTSVLISILQFGCRVASTNFTAVDSHFADLIQGIILFVILAADFFIRFKVVIDRPKRAQ